jgi:hypothetical protein
MKRPLGRCRRRWDDNVKMSPKEIGWNVMCLNSCRSEKGQVAGCRKSGNEVTVSVNCEEFLVQLRTWYLLNKFYYFRDRELKDIKRT